MKVRCISITYTNEGFEFLFEDKATEGEDVEVHLRCKNFDAYQIGKDYFLDIK